MLRRTSILFLKGRPWGGSCHNLLHRLRLIHKGSQHPHNYFKVVNPEGFPSNACGVSSVDVRTGRRNKGMASIRYAGHLFVQPASSNPAFSWYPIPLHFERVAHRACLVEELNTADRSMLKSGNMRCAFFFVLPNKRLVFGRMLTGKNLVRPFFFFRRRRDILAVNESGLAIIPRAFRR